MLAFRFAQYILRGRYHAIILALIFAGLPYFDWVSGVIIGLVTFRKGKMEGFLVLLWSLLPGIGFAAYSKAWLPFAMSTLFSSVLVWLAASLLRYRGNWVWVLYFTALIGLALVGVFHIVVPDTAAWWLKELNTNLQQVEQTVTLQTKEQANLEVIFQLLAQVATGLKIALFSLLALMELFFARGLEYLLMKPGGLAREFKKVRLHLLASVVLIACAVLAKVGPTIFLDFLPVLALPFVVAGISLAHSLLMKSKRAPGLLMVFYFILIFAVLFIPALLVIFIGMAILDSLIHFRRRETCK